MPYLADVFGMCHLFGVVFLGATVGGFLASLLAIFAFLIAKKISARSARVLSSTRALDFPPLPCNFQSGSARLVLLVALSAVGVGLLACAAPPAHYSDAHGVWLEHVKKGGW